VRALVNSKGCELEIAAQGIIINILKRPINPTIKPNSVDLYSHYLNT
jgi:hypothetical protein